jgi:carboxylesterase type B
MEMGNLAGVIHTMVPYTSFPFLDADLTKVTQHFFGPDPLVAAAIAARYPGRDFPTAEARFEAFFRDYLFKCTTLNALQSMAAHTSGDGSSAYFHYEFRYIGQPNQSSLPVHADELEFVWGVPTHRSPADLAMAANMGALWASFIRSGDPAAGNDGLQPRWQQYDAATQKDLFTLVLDQPLSSTTSSYTEAQCDMWAKFPGWLPPMPAELETVGGAAALTSRAAERIALA